MFHAGVSTRNRQSKSEEDEECGICRKKVMEMEKAVVCDVCTTWYHLGCGGVGNELYKAIEKFGYRGTKELPWQCKICRKFAVGLQQEILKMSQRQEKMEKKLKEMEKKLDSSDRKINVVQAKVEENKEDLEQVKASVESALGWEGELEDIKEKLRMVELQPRTFEEEGKVRRETIREEVSEAIERDKRRNRIVISKLTTDERGEDLQRKVKDLLQSLGFSEEGIVRKVMQLQDKKFLSVELENKEAKNKVLQRAKKLKENVQYRDVYIRPDLTYRQRKEERKLREEMKARVLKGEKNLRIKNGQLVQVVEIPQELQEERLGEEESLQESR